MPNGGYLRACVMVLVAQGNRDRPAGRVLGTPRSVLRRSCGRGQRCGSRCSSTCRPTVHRPADGTKSERPVEYQGVLAGSLLP